MMRRNGLQCSPGTRRNRRRNGNMTRRKLEASIHTDLNRDNDYTAYLALDVLLEAQKPLSDPPHHDEMLFIIQHQITELWIKLVIHEIEGASNRIRDDDLPPAVKNLARVKHIQTQMFNQWMVLDTLTPSEYAQFRHVFGKASGFQSPQYRLLEFLLGNKSATLLTVYEHQPVWHERLVNDVALLLPLSDPPHHDEMLFIIQHQITELWIKLVIHEIEGASNRIRDDDLPPAVKNLARVKHIQTQMFNQWMVLDTLTPSEYAQFRHVFGKASGFQSPQYRLLEFLLGNKSATLLTVYEHQPVWHERLVNALNAPLLFPSKKLHFGPAA